MLKLQAELVPQSSWWNNMRKVLPARHWDKIRKDVYAKYDYKCAICGAEGRLNCHEIWEYNDKTYVQTLKGFVALCDLCHHVKHIGLASILAQEGRLDFQRVVAHFCRVNECDEAMFKCHLESAMHQWEQRSAHEWTVDWGEYADLIPG